MTENTEELNKIIKELDDVETIRSKERRVLAQILDKERSQQNKYMALRGMMGKTRTDGGRAISIPSYSVMHSLDWIGRKNLLMGSEMDFMKSKIDPKTGRIIIDEESAEEMKQRAPDWTRQADLTTYLIQEKYHKFGTILAVISPSWINDPDHENWGADGRALTNAGKFESLDSEGNIGLLDLSDAEVYALDGQHRVMGIRGILDVMEGALVLRKKDGEEKNRIPKDNLLARLGADINDLNKLLNERINVEYVPAVLAGETRDEASRRIRSVFVAINQYAKAPDKGENILLQENDGHSIVARRLGHHQMFVDDNNRTRVNWKNAQIGKAEEQNITTLQALKTCVEHYVEQYKQIDWKPIFKTVSLRPPEAELKSVQDELTEVFDRVANLPVFMGLDSGDSLRELREFPDPEHPMNRGHVLLRPIGLPILFDAVSRVLESKKQSLDQVFKKLEKFDRERGFDAPRAAGIWFKVTYDPDKRKMIITNQRLAADLLRYMLEGADSEAREKLVREMLACRKVSEREWIDYDGEVSKLELESIDLPKPIKIS